MSSTLTTLVPVLDGTNFQEWASEMKSYLMSQGQWRCIKKPYQPSPPFQATSSKKKKEGEEEPTDVPIPEDDDEEREAFEELNDKAVGNIHL